MAKQIREDNGFKVRLVSGEEKHFKTATRVQELPDGGILLKNEYVTVGGFKKAEFSTYWKMFKLATGSRSH
jgi:hypothetical protein